MPSEFRSWQCHTCFTISQSPLSERMNLTFTWLTRAFQNTYETVTRKYTPKLCFATQTNKLLIKKKTKQNTHRHKKTFRSRIVLGKNSTLVQKVGKLALPRKVGVVLGVSIGTRDPLGTMAFWLLHSRQEPESQNWVKTWFYMNMQQLIPISVLKGNWGLLFFLI